MQTEDDLGAGLRDRTLTVDDVITAFQGDEVVVYDAMNLVEGEETWQDVEDLGGGSTLFSDLHFAGASPEQMDEVGAQIERARMEGRTMSAFYGWPTDEAPAEASTPAESGTEEA